MNNNHFEGFFYDVQDNGFGHYQTYQVDEQGEFPVCSSCHAMVMINRGQGSACDTCQHEAYMHCQADYED